jgi:hypothetical protein
MKSYFIDSNFAEFWYTPTKSGITNAASVIGSAVARRKPFGSRVTHAIKDDNDISNFINCLRWWTSKRWTSK